MSTVQQRFLGSIAGSPSEYWTRLRLQSGLFEDDPIALNIFEYFAEVAIDRPILPTREDVLELFQTMLPKETVGPDALFIKLRESRVRRGLSKLTTEQQATVSKDPFGALEAILKTSLDLRAELAPIRTATFNAAIDTIWPWLTQKWSGQIVPVPMAWPSINASMGGVYGGEMISFVGRPGLGKSWLMLKQAYDVWLELNEPVLFFSEEMLERKVQERMISLHTGIPPDFFKDGLGPTLFGNNLRQTVQKALVDLKASSRAPFVIVDANLTATLDDVVSLANSTKACSVFVDGAYMLRVPGRGNLKGFERIEEICNTLKSRVASAADIPVFASWQFNREATKVKKKGAPSLEQIAGGDTIGMISSVVLGAVDDSASDDDNVEGLLKRVLHIIKGRDGEQGQFAVDWSFTDMKFSEIEQYKKLYLEAETD